MSETFKDIISSTLNNTKNCIYKISKLDIEFCLLKTTSEKKSFYMSYPDRIISKRHIRNFNKLINTLEAGIPLSYVLNSQDFYNYSYYVDKNVLIPRPETEIIIEPILKFGDIIYKKNKDVRLIDAGSGSGCIGLTLSQERKNWNILLTEKSQKALKVLLKNIQKAQDKNCKIISCDWIKAVKKDSADIIVSNPPYIKKGSTKLYDCVNKNEPHSALFSESDGMADIRKIIIDSKRVLKKDGILVLENGYDQSQKVIDVLRENYYKDIHTILDYNKIKRFTISRNS